VYEFRERNKLPVRRVGEHAKEETGGGEIGRGKVEKEER
jgi:hypothetical protein